jgi:hypothetical protein
VITCYSTVEIEAFNDLAAMVMADWMLGVAEHLVVETHPLPLRA